MIIMVKYNTIVFLNNNLLIVNNSVVMKTPTNLRYPKFAEDRKLGLRYSRAMQVLTRKRQMDERPIEK